MASPDHVSQSPTATQPSQSDTPASSKRAPDEEVQFVSSKPVKKRRTSLPSGKPTGPPQQLDSSQPKCPQGMAKDQLEVSANPSTPENVAQSSSPNEVPAVPGTLLQGSMIPGMECFTFPLPSSSMTNLPPHSSPELSPKQLPHEATSQYSTTTATGLNQSNMDLMTFPELFNPTIFDGFENSWDLANWVPQPALMTPEAALNQRMLNPPSHLQPNTQALGPPSEYPMTLPSPLPFSQPGPSQPALTCNPSGNAQAADLEQKQQQTTPKKEDSPQPAKDSIPPAPPTDSKPQTLVTTAAPQETQAAPEKEKEATPQPREASTARPPCLICAKLRQQAIINQSNGSQVGPVLMSGAANEHHLHAHSPHPQPIVGPNHNCSPGLNSHLRFQYLNPPMSMMYGSGGAATPGPLRPVAPYILGGVLAQAPLSSSAPVMTGSALQYTTMPNLQQPQGKERQAPTSAKKAIGGSQLAGKPHSPAASKRKPPPNLIVDVAETCEEVFPFDEVAKRHNVPRHKVVEVFSAIVQLPLLRCATDKRRAGKLAQTRMKEFTKAKKDSQAASTTGAQGKRDTTPAGTQEKGPILPGVMELAKNMPPMEYPGVPAHGFTGPW